MSSAPWLHTPAQRLLAERLLAWGESRPVADLTLVDGLWSELARVTEELGEDLERAAATARRGQLWITKTRLDHLACDGLAIDARPFERTWASMRGILTHAVIERDLDEARSRPVGDVVASTWHAEATRAHGDPSSSSAWMNALSNDDAGAMREELVALLDTFRDVWPLVPGDHVEVRTEDDVAVPIADGRVLLFGRPDLVLRSRHHDERARSLVVDLKTGRPRPEQDRHELRFYALLVTLASGEPPFRWATLYVTEGRYEHEDLRASTLEVTARRVADGIRQQVRIAGRPSGAEDADLTIRAGGWCMRCSRQDDCEVAARHRADEAAVGDV